MTVACAWCDAAGAERSEELGMALCGRCFAEYADRLDAAGNGASRARALVVRPASTIRPRPIRWAWAERVPLGAVTLLAGRQGLGKSTLAARLAADFTRGKLEGDLAGQPAAALVASYEDPAPILAARLRAAGADLALAGVVSLHEDGVEGLLTLPRDLALLAERARAWRARLLVIDPLVAGLDGRIDAHRDRDVRRALAPLAKLAEELELAVLAVIHLRKGGASEALDRVSSSIAFTAAARSVLAFGPGEDAENGERVVAVAKSNWTAPPPSLALRLRGAELEVGGEQLSASTIEFVGECAISADELLVPERREPASEREAAREWLAAQLADGAPQFTSDLIDAARAADVSRRTLFRAAAELERAGELVRERGGFPARAIWRATSCASRLGTTGGGTTGTTGVTKPDLHPSGAQLCQNHGPGTTAVETRLAMPEEEAKIARLLRLDLDGDGGSP